MSFLNADLTELKLTTLQLNIKNKMHLLTEDKKQDFKKRIIKRIKANLNSKNHESDLLFLDQLFEFGLISYDYVRLIKEGFKHYDKIDFISLVAFDMVIHIIHSNHSKHIDTITQLKRGRFNQ